MSPATRDAVLSARVPHDLRADYERLAELDGAPDLSLIVRKGLRVYADHRLGRAPIGAAGLLAGEGTARRRGTRTEKAAARDVTPRAGTQRRRVLEHYEDAAPDGLTADEVLDRMEDVARALGTTPPASNSIPRRVTDLLQAQLIRPATFLNRAGDETWTEELTRITRHGAQAQVYEITAAGARALEDARDHERHIAAKKVT